MRSAGCALLPTNGAAPPPAEDEGSEGEGSEGDGEGSGGEGHGSEGEKAPDVEDALADGDSSHKCDAPQMLLLLACKLDDPKALREHLMNGASADVVDADGHSPLFYAVVHGHMECVKVLLDAKAPLDPELVAYAVDHPSVLALLLDANASPNGSDKLQPPLIIAGVRGQPESMQMLLDAGARFDSDWPEDAGYPAWARLSMLLDQNGVVINQWHTKCLHLLVQRDEHLHSKTSTAVENLEQLLCAMSVQGSPTGIQILLNAGTNPDAMPTGHDVPPLALACTTTEKSSHHLESVRVLLHGTRRPPRSPRALSLYVHPHPRTPLLASSDPTYPRLVQAAPTLRSSSTAVSSRPSLPPPRTSPSRTATTASSG